MEATNGAEDVRLLLISTGRELVLKLLDLALNDGTTAGRGVRSEPKDVALVLKEFVNLLEPDVVFHNRANLLESGLLHDTGDASEGLSHDSNEQVHEDELHDDRSKDEHDPDNLGVLCRVVILAKLS